MCVCMLYIKTQKNTKKQTKTDILLRKCTVIPLPLIFQKINWNRNAWQGAQTLRHRRPVLFLLVTELYLLVMLHRRPAWKCLILLFFHQENWYWWMQSPPQCLRTVDLELEPKQSGSTAEIPEAPLAQEENELIKWWSL